MHGYEKVSRAQGSYMCGLLQVPWLLADYCLFRLPGWLASCWLTAGSLLAALGRVLSYEATRTYVRYTATYM